MNNKSCPFCPLFLAYNAAIRFDVTDLLSLEITAGSLSYPWQPCDTAGFLHKARRRFICQFHSGVRIVASRFQSGRNACVFRKRKLQRPFTDRLEKRLTAALYPGWSTGRTLCTIQAYGGAYASRLRSITTIWTFIPGTCLDALK